MARTNQPATTSIASGTTIIGAGIRVNGRVNGGEDLQVEGRVEGSIQLSETLIVAGEGVVVAEVKARDVVVSGVIVGNVFADNAVTLNPGAKLVGDIAAPRLIIADGAAFSGNVSMSGDPPPARARDRRTARPRAVARPARAEQTAASSRSRVAAVQKATSPSRDDSEVTVVVKHAALAEEKKQRAAQAAAAKKKAAARKKAKKAPPRARVPKRGKRRVTRR